MPLSSSLTRAQYSWASICFRYLASSLGLSGARTDSELSGFGLRRGLDFGLGSGSGFPNLSSSPSGFTSDSYINCDHCKLCLISFQNSLRALEQTDPRLYRAFGLCSTGPALLPMPVPALGLSLMPAN